MNQKKNAATAVAAAFLAVSLVCLGAPPSLAQDPAEPSGEAASVEVSPKERRRQAKEARIEEYLRRKEERRAQRELQEKLEATGDAQAAVVPPLDMRAGAERPAPVHPNRQSARTSSKLPRNLARAQENVRGTALGRDSTVQTYLDMIERQAASPAQLAAFGNFLADNGLVNDALEYYDVALGLEPQNPLLWLNYGTLHRQAGDPGGAMSAYNRVLSLDPNNAMAHYNIGAILENQGKYKPSIEAYRRALTLDPTLGDPAYNPQSVNSERLLAVKLLLYRDQAGSRGLPLEQIPAAGQGSQEPAEPIDTAEEEPRGEEQDPQPQRD